MPHFLLAAYIGSFALTFLGYILRALITGERPKSFADLTLAAAAYQTALAADENLRQLIGQNAFFDLQIENIFAKFVLLLLLNALYYIVFLQFEKMYEKCKWQTDLAHKCVSFFVCWIGPVAYLVFSGLIPSTTWTLR